MIDKEEEKKRLAVELELNRLFTRKAAMLFCDGDEERFLSRKFWGSAKETLTIEKWKRGNNGRPTGSNYGPDRLFDFIEMVSVYDTELECQFSFEVCRLKKRGFLWRRKCLYRLCEFNDFNHDINTESALAGITYVSDERLVKLLKYLYKIARVNDYGSDDSDGDGRARWYFYEGYKDSIKLLKGLKPHGKRQKVKITVPVVPDKPFSDKVKGKGARGGKSRAKAKSGK